MGTSKLSGKPDEMLGVTCNGLASHPGGVAILLVTSCYGNRDKLRLCGPLGSCTVFTIIVSRIVLTCKTCLFVCCRFNYNKCLVWTLSIHGGKVKLLTRKTCEKSF